MDEQAGYGMPNHIGIIPDGNRRWARKRGLPEKLGHYYGIKTAKKIVNFIFNETDVNYLTLYGFSKYNFNRDEEEKSALFYMMADVVKELSEWIPDDVGFIPAGDFSKFEAYKLPGSSEGGPSNLKELIEATAKASNSGRYFTVLVGYDGVDEIEAGAERLLEAQKSGDACQQVSGKDIWKYTYTSDLPPIDLMIRTGNEQRLSGFAPYLVSYAELYFDKKMWPAFSKRRLKKILKSYGKRDRRFGR